MMRVETPLSTLKRESSNHHQMSNTTTKRHHQQRSDRSSMLEEFKKAKPLNFDGEIRILKR